MANAGFCLALQRFALPLIWICYEQQRPLHLLWFFHFPPLFVWFANEEIEKVCCVWKWNCVLCVCLCFFFFFLGHFICYILLFWIQNKCIQICTYGMNWNKMLIISTISIFWVSKCLVSIPVEWSSPHRQWLLILNFHFFSTPFSFIPSVCCSFACEEVPVFVFLFFPVCRLSLVFVLFLALLLICFSFSIAKKLLLL